MLLLVRIPILDPPMRQRGYSGTHVRSLPLSSIRNVFCCSDLGIVVGSNRCVYCTHTITSFVSSSICTRLRALRRLAAFFSITTVIGGTVIIVLSVGGRSLALRPLKLSKPVSNTLMALLLPVRTSRSSPCWKLQWCRKWSPLLLAGKLPTVKDIGTRTSSFPNPISSVLITCSISIRKRCF